MVTAGRERAKRPRKSCSIFGQKMPLPIDFRTVAAMMVGRRNQEQTEEDNTYDGRSDCPG